MERNEIRIVRLSHAVPQNGQTFKPHWHLVYPVLSVLPGVHDTIDGQRAYYGGGVMWSGSRHFPDFASRDEGMAYAQEHGLPLVMVDL